MSVSIHAQSTEWSKRGITQVTVEADKAVRRQNWSAAIIHAEKLVEANQAIFGLDSKEYIAALVRLNRYHSRANRLGDIRASLEWTYNLSKKRLGVSHDLTATSRFLFYKFLVSDKQYERAILLVQENLSCLGSGKKKDEKLHRYLNQLRFLYALTNKLEEEERILLQLIQMDNEAKDYAYGDHKQVIADLARNYCRRKMLFKFNDLVKEKQLYYFCEQDKIIPFSSTDKSKSK